MSVSRSLGNPAFFTHTGFNKYPREKLRLSSAFGANLLLAIAALATTMTGCATLTGTIPGAERRADDYAYDAPSLFSPDWKPLPSTPAPQFSEAALKDRPVDSSDFAWQSAQSASIISLTTACRGEMLTTNAPSLEDLSRQLLMGITEVRNQDTKERQVAGFQALETTTEGSLSGQQIQLRSIVLRNGPCTYDLVLIARPARFASAEDTFARFVDSFRIR